MISKKVSVTAEFPNFKPAHKRFVTENGEGSNIWVAIQQGIRKISKNEKLKGKRNLVPFKLIVTSSESE